jgi:hypothetical protein
MKISPAHVQAASRRLLPEEDELRELLGTVRWRDIAKRFGVISSVHHAATRMGFGRQPKHLIVGGSSHRVLPDDETMRSLIERMPVREIASRYGVSYHAGYKRLRRIGAGGQLGVFRKTKLSELPQDYLRHRLETTRWTDLADELEVSLPTIYLHARKLGIDRQPAHLRPSRKKPVETGATAMPAYPDLEARP